MTDFYQEENIYLLETVLKVCMKSYANVCQSSLGEYILEELIFILFYFIFLFFFGSVGKDEVTKRVTVCLPLFYIKIHGWSVGYLKCRIGRRFCLMWNALRGWSYVSVPSRYWPTVFDENHEKARQYSQISNCIFRELNWSLIIYIRPTVSASMFRIRGC